MAKAVTATKKKVHVHARLFEVDVKELKRRGKASDIPWQILLRNLIHEALKKEARIA